MYSSHRTTVSFLVALFSIAGTINFIEGGCIFWNAFVLLTHVLGSDDWPTAPLVVVCVCVCYARRFANNSENHVSVINSTSCRRSFHETKRTLIYFPFFS